MLPIHLLHTKRVSGIIIIQIKLVRQSFINFYFQKYSINIYLEFERQFFSNCMIKSLASALILYK